MSQDPAARIAALTEEQRRRLAEHLQSGASPRAARPAELSIFFFADDPQGGYDFLFQMASLAEDLGFDAVWTPERHFHAFGGLYPNPSVLTAALAARTSTIKLRAGSVVLPLHHPVRVCEDWSLLDNLSGGRVGISVASGWHQQDFVLASEPFARRREVMFERIETIARLWRGERVELSTPDGETFAPVVQPRPIQPELPMWVTSSGRTETYVAAGERRANLLASLIGQSLPELTEKIRAYREARRAAHGDSGHVTVMVHTFVGETRAEARAVTRAPLRAYLSAYLEQQADMTSGSDSRENVELQLDFAYERYVADASLIGDRDQAAAMLGRLAEAGVDEAACLIDFGVPLAETRESLRRLADVRAALAPRVAQ